MSLEKFIVYLLICFFLSFFIGIERQYRHRSVGLRTTILVAIGSYLFVSFSVLLNGYNIDVTRIAAQIVTGIGFLGAGVILKDGVKIRGLTTAATLWCLPGFLLVPRTKSVLTVSMQCHKAALYTMSC